MRNLLYLLAISTFFGVIACNDPLELETDLFLEDEADIQFKNDFLITATTIVEDSILAYSSTTEYSNYPFGAMVDPVFGQSTSSIYGQLRYIPPFVAPNLPTGNFPIGNLDSIVLSLAYSTEGSYGNIDEPFGLDVHRIVEDIDADADYYSNQVFAVDPMPLGSKLFTPSPSDSVEINIYRDGFVSDSLYKRPAHERINLSTAFGEELYALDSVDFTDSDLLLQKLQGLHFRPSTTNSGLIGFDLRSGDTRLTLYYRDTLNLPSEFNFYFTELSAKTLNMEADPTGAPVAEFIDNPSMGDSLLFTQGMAGSIIKVVLPGITDLSNIIVNKAELEFFIADDIDNPADSLLTTTEQLIALEESTIDGTKILVEDASVAFSASSLDLFGGTIIDEGNGVRKYNMNISTHLQEMVDGTAPNTIFIQPFPKPSNFSRVILYGAKHSTYPMRLRLTYTQL